MDGTLRLIQTARGVQVACVGQGHGHDGHPEGMGTITPNNVLRIYSTTSNDGQRHNHRVEFTLSFVEALGTILKTQ